MPKLDKTYNITLDIKQTINNSIPQYYISDNDTSEIMITITDDKKPIQLDNVIVLMVAIAPDREKLYDFIDVRTSEEGLIYCNLKSQFKDLEGTWYARLMIISNEEKLVTDTFSYNVKTDDFIDMNDEVIDDDRYPLLSDIISRLSTIEITELSRQNIESIRVKEEKIRVANENIRISNEQTRQSQHTASLQSIDNKIVDIENRFRTMSASQQQDSEVIDARDGETSLHARLERDLAKGKVIEEKVEGTYITVKESVVGDITDIEILGNTTQDTLNLADIQSVGTLEEDGRYKMSILSCGISFVIGGFGNGLGVSYSPNTTATNRLRTETLFEVTPGSNYRIECAKGYEVSLGLFNSDNIIKQVAAWSTDNFLEVTLNTDIVKMGILVRKTGSPVLSSEDIKKSKVVIYGDKSLYNKSSILLPCQLEKVGDVRDRLFRREDGVWCIEKNVMTTNILSTFAWIKNADTETELGMYANNILPNLKNTQFVTNSNIVMSTYKESGGGVNLKIQKSLLSTSDLSGFKKYLEDNKIVIKTTVSTPQIIELPLDTQIQLNSFNGITNIFTEDTVIEPTIKATVPKSLGASVNSLVNKTDNLSQRLENVEILKEGQEIEVSSDKGYAVCQDTRNGYVEDLKVEGNTLVNLAITKNINIDTNLNRKISTTNYEFAKKYTLIFNSDKTDTNLFIQERNGELWVKNLKVGVTQGINILSFTSSSSGIDGLRFGTNASVIYPINITNIILLEGDHTQNPPSYFEGLKSIGDGLDKIEVLSRGKNLFDGQVEVGTIEDNGTLKQDNNARRSINYIKVNKSMQLTCYNGGNNYLVFIEYSNNYQILGTVAIAPKYSKTFSCKGDYLKFRYEGSDFSTLQLEEGTVATTYEPYKGNKKQLLYKNSEGEYVKPTLRCANSVSDSIEKHSDGKYYFHKRCEQIVLNGDLFNVSGTTYQSDVIFSAYIAVPLYGSINTINCVCDKFSATTVATLSKTPLEGIATGSNTMVISIAKSKLSTQDLTGFKKWLSENNVTAVYQLATEEVYECVNLDLDSYEGETSVIFDGGAISPTTSFKVTSHIGNVISKMKDNVAENTKFREELTESVTLYKESENGYLVAEDTKDGYVNDLKIEGKTLVNLEVSKSKFTLKADTTARTKYIDWGHPLNTGQFTVKVDCIGTVSEFKLQVEFIEGDAITGIKSSNGVYYFDTNGKYIKRIMYYISSGDFTGTKQWDISNIIILEGDHTQNPPSYFEGLKSVGDTSDKIEVLSQGKNLFKNKWLLGYHVNTDDGSLKQYGTTLVTEFMSVKSNTTYILSNLKLSEGTYKGSGFRLVAFYDKNHNFIEKKTLGNYSINESIFTTPKNCRFMRFCDYSGMATDDIMNNYPYLNTIQLEEGTIATTYEPHQQNKKQILFKNSSGVYEKPILRSTGTVSDTIEKHSDGKYYFHKRCEEVVLNGSEDWVSFSFSEKTESVRFYLAKIDSKRGGVVCDKLTSSLALIESNTMNGDGIGTINGQIRINLYKSKLASQDLTGFKQWLQANNVTVVYQLAQEEIYEVVNLDLDSYEGETSVIFEGGDISPKMSMKIASRLANTIQILKDKVNYLENRVMDMFRAVLAGDVQTLAYELYPEDFKKDTQESEQLETVEGTELL